MVQTDKEWARIVKKEYLDFKHRLQGKIPTTFSRDMMMHQMLWYYRQHIYGKGVRNVRNMSVREYQNLFGIEEN